LPRRPRAPPHPVRDQACLRALMWALRRLLWRAALFLWIRPRAEERSRIGWAAADAASAPAASLASRALRTFFTAVRSIERWLALRELRTRVCLARFLADLMWATEGSWKRFWKRLWEWWIPAGPCGAGQSPGTRRPRIMGDSRA